MFLVFQDLRVLSCTVSPTGNDQAISRLLQLQATLWPHISLASTKEVRPYLAHTKAL